MRVTLVSRRLAAAALGGVLALGLTACSSDDDEPDDTTNGESSSDTDEEPVSDTTEEAGAADDADEAEPEEAGDGDSAAAEWAEPITTPGELVTTIEGETFQVEVYQVGVAASPKDGFLADPDTNEPILAEGDDIVFVNYVVTNTSGEAVDLSSSLVAVDATYADWEYLQGMDSVTDYDLFEQMEVNDSGVAESLDPPIYTLGPGQSFSYGTNFMYKTDSPIVFDATLTPVDADGELLSDQRQEASAEATLS